MSDMSWYLTPERIDKMHRDEAASRRAARWIWLWPSVAGGCIGTAIALKDILGL
jgi:hypothetical protein